MILALLIKTAVQLEVYLNKNRQQPGYPSKAEETHEMRDWNSAPDPHGFFRGRPLPMAKLPSGGRGGAGRAGHKRSGTAYALAARSIDSMISFSDPSTPTHFPIRVHLPSSRSL